MNRSITVETVVRADMETVWMLWTSPVHIQNWLHASDDWECPQAQNDLREGGQFSFRMAAKDGSAGFDFGGTYTEVVEGKKLSYTMGQLQDARKVAVSFEETPEGVKITETFDMENENSEEMQRSGWQAILDNFKKYVEGYRAA
jgi:uncharacterized protein YndB with AHSA1/START domain